MFRPIVLAIVFSLSSISPMLLPQAARSQSTVLTRATIAALRNQVRLIRKNQAARAARVSDVMAPGDAIATATNSIAELRFNDNSLARLGAQTVFRFNAGTRAVDLSRGTALMLIQPGQGGSTIRTPNAAAGINGSAIFCRYNSETDTTIFGALTDSGIEIFNADGSQRLELKGGQMAVVVAGRIDRVYNIDLDLFYETSPLVQGLDITNPNGETDKRLNPVRSEVNEALERQSPLNGEATIVNPEFVRLPESEAEFGDVTATVIDFNFNDYLSRDRNSANPNLTAIERDRDNIRSILTGGQIQTLPTNNPSFNTNTAFPNSPNMGGSGNAIPGNRGFGGIFPGSDRNNTPGNVNNGGNFPGGGATNGNFPGQGNGNGGNFPGQGNGNGGNFPGQGNGNGGNFPGQGNGNGGNFPGQGNGNGGNFPGQGNGNGGNFPGGGATNGNFPGQGNFPGGGNGRN